MLPALPAAWKTGHVTGLKAVGNFTVDISWKDGQATRITVVNNGGQVGVVKYPGLSQAHMFVDGLSQEADPNESNTVFVSPEKGSVTVFDFDGSYDPTGIVPIKEGTLAYTVNGRTVTVSGCKVKKLQAFDLQGRLVGSTSRPTLAVGKGAGDMVVVNVTTQDGHKQALKVKF